MTKPFRFDLQLFADPPTTTVRKTKQLSNIAIEELSLVFAQKDGKAWAPRNPDAVVIGTKAGEVGERKASFLDRFAKAVKGWYVKDDVPDNIDGDGDGAEDYEQILGIVTQMGYDLQSAMWMVDEDMRSAAIVAGIDSMLARLDDVRGGGSGKKAGARHSKADKAHLDALADAHQKMGEHLKALGASSSDGGSDEGGDVDDDDAEKARALFKAALVGEDGLPSGAVAFASKAGTVVRFDSHATFVARVDKAKKKKKEDDEPYGDVEYADPGYQEDGKKRYPLDTEEHVRAAASYFGKESNRSKYTEKQQKEIDAKIDAAKKKFGIGESDDDGKKAGEVDMTEAQVQAMINAAVTSAVAKASEQFAAQSAKDKADAQAQIDKAKADAEAATKAAQEAQAALGTAATNARKTSATSVATTTNGEPSRLQKAIKAQLAANPDSTKF